MKEWSLLFIHLLVLIDFISELEWPILIEIILGWI